MSDSDEKSDSDQAGLPEGSGAGRQYVSELLRELEAVSSELLRGRGRFPASHELSHAPAQFRSILAIAQRVVGQWGTISPEVADGVEQSLMQLVDIVAEIEAQEPMPEDVMPGQRRYTSGAIKGRLNEIQQFFRGTVEPLVDHPDDSRSVTASLSDEEIENVRMTREDLDRSKQEIAELKARSAQIDAELDSRRELVEAARTVSGAGGAQDLAAAYQEQAEDQERHWKYWGSGLVVTLVAALVGGYLVLRLNRPTDDATTAQLVSHLAIDLLIVGLLIYAVRVTSLQFSVHRHLAAVAHNKAAALVTFSRIVSSGSSPETRDRLAEVLAHYVFVSSDTGFLDSAGDQVTLPERLVTPIAQRINGSGAPI